ncbi:MAG: asparagine synthase C-terminal domain-containing protein [Candidatus Hodarchaeota archaeon]
MKKENVLMLGYDLIAKPMLAIETNYDWKNYLIKEIKMIAEKYKRPAIALSGGIDSSVIAYYLKKYNKNSIAFTMGLNDNIPIEESQEITKKLEMEHITQKINFTKSDLNLTLWEIFNYFYPFDKGSLIPCWILVNALSKHDFDCVLFGDGADELFGGYNRHINKNPNWESDIMIYNTMELKTIWNLEPDEIALDFQIRYNNTKNIEERLKLEWEYEFPNAHLLKMEKFCQARQINYYFPYLNTDVRFSALATRPKVDISKQIKKMPLYNLYHRLFRYDREKIPLKFDYLKYISSKDIKNNTVRDYLKTLSHESRNYDRKVWLAYLLEKYEECKPENILSRL